VAAAVGEQIRLAPKEQEVLVVVMAGLTVVRQLLVLPTQVVEVVVEVMMLIMDNQAALALLSLKYLTTYPQHSLVALHLACPHLSLGSTSTL
jgi:hypothetical protein